MHEYARTHTRTHTRTHPLTCVQAYVRTCVRVCVCVQPGSTPKREIDTLRVRVRVCVCVCKAIVETAFVKQYSGVGVNIPGTSDRQQSRPHRRLSEAIVRPEPVVLRCAACFCFFSRLTIAWHATDSAVGPRKHMKETRGSPGEVLFHSVG